MLTITSNEAREGFRGYPQVLPAYATLCRAAQHEYENPSENPKWHRRKKCRLCIGNYSEDPSLDEQLTDLQEILESVIRAALADEALASGLRGRIGEMEDRLGRRRIEPASAGRSPMR